MGVRLARVGLAKTRRINLDVAHDVILSPEEFARDRAPDLPTA